MNKKIVIFAFLISIGTLRIVESAGPGRSLFEGWNFTEVTSTGTQLFMGAGRVASVYISSDTDGSTTEKFLQVLDTVAIAGNTYLAFTTETKKSPPIVFSTATTTSNLPGLIKSIDYGEYGIIITSGCFVYKSNVNSGESVKGYIKWTQ